VVSFNGVTSYRNATSDRINGFNVTKDDFDPTALEMLERPYDLLRRSRARHYPEVRRSETEVGIAIHQNDAMAPVEAAAQSVGGGDPTHATAQHHDGLRRAAHPVGH
jgi:hypothetical protein